MSTASSAYDAVVVGAGLTGSMIANKLGQEGFSVLVIDAGDQAYFDTQSGVDQREPLLDRFFRAGARVPNSPYPNLPYAPMEYEENLGTYYFGPQYAPRYPPGTPAPAPAPPPETATPEGGSWAAYRSTYARVVGGTMYHWLGTTLRYLPSTFQEKTLFGHSVDWPLTYDQLEDWYFRAEHEIGVSGDSTRELGSPRHGKPYPMPMILQSYTDRVMAERLEGLSFEGLPVLVEPTPQGRNSVPYQGRPPCAGSTNCVPICPIQAKYDATVHLKRALNPALDPANKAGSRAVEHRWGQVVTRVDVGADGRVESVTCKDGHTREEQRFSGKLVILCTHAVESAKILLMSGGDQSGLHAGVANSSGLVGRYLMDHHVKVAHGMADVPLYPFRGPLSTSGIESLRDGEFRRHRSAFRVEIEAIGANWALNSPFGTFNEKLSAGLIGAQLRRAVGWDVNRQVELDALFEPMPNFDSRVSLARDAAGNFVCDELGVPRPRLDFVLDDFTVRGGLAFAEVANMIMKRMGGSGATIEPGWYGAGHSMGTLRMGSDPKQSVADSHGRSWDHDNLYLTGSGLFPTVCSANPTLTIVAVTLRQIEHLKARLAG